MLVLTSFCPSPPTDVSSRACVGSDTTVVMVTLLMTSSKASKHNLAKHLQAGDQLFILFVIMFTLFCEQAIGCLMCLWSCLLCFTKLSVRCRIKGDEKGIIFTASTRQAALYSWCYQSYVPCGAVCSVHTLVFTCLAVYVVVVVVVPCIVFCPHSFLVGTCCVTCPLLVSRVYYYQLHVLRLLAPSPLRSRGPVAPSVVCLFSIVYSPTQMLTKMEDG